jgi:hypothetical protein
MVEGHDFRMILDNIKRKLVVFKFTLSRGYAWCQLPTMAIMGAGILYPYTKDILPWMKMWMLAIFALLVFISVGWIDRSTRLLHEENSYSTETNPTLMKGLFPEKNSLLETEKYLKDNNVTKNGNKEENKN